MAQDVETNFCCPDCGERLALTEEVVLVRVVYYMMENGVEKYYDVEADGDFKYEPYYFHLGHWEDAVDELGVDDDTPVLTSKSSVRDCDVCGSGIDNKEMVCLLTPGELRLSQRSPGNAPSFYFAGIAKPKVMCLSCALRLNENVIELWSEGVTYQGECSDGVHRRCWKNGRCVACTEGAWQEGAA